MKKRAWDKGCRANDYYAEVIESFVDERLDQLKLLYATPRYTVPVSIPMPVAFVEAIRSRSSAKGFTLNELIMTAVAVHLEAESLAA